MDFGSKQTHFFVITIHFITDKWEFESYIFDFHKYIKESTTAEKVRENLLTTFRNHHIDETLLSTNMIITTDQGSNLISALQPYIRLSDPCHLLNILSKRVESPYKKNFLPPNFEIDNETRNTLRMIEETINSLMKIIKAVNSRPTLKQQLKRLGTSLISSGETRWLSRLRSIQSFCNLNQEQRQLIHGALWDHKYNGEYIYRNALNNVYPNENIVQSYVRIVAPIEKTLKIFEKENEPTINRYLIEMHALRNHFESFANDTNIFHLSMSKAAIKVMEYQHNTTYSEYHLLGLLLDPLNKDSISEMPYIPVVDSIRIFKHYVNNGTADEGINRPHSPFSVYRTTPVVHPTDTEVDNYLDLSSATVSQTYNNVLDFWRHKENDYPHIAKLAKMVLSATGSSSSERVFRLLGRTLTTERAAMSPSTVATLIQMKNLNKFKASHPEVAEEASELQLEEEGDETEEMDE